MTKDKKILVVDDLSMNRILLCEVLELIGFGFSVAKNGKEALDILYAEDSDIEIVLMDIEMPVMNGIEATMHIKKCPILSKKIKVIGVTAHDPNLFFKDFENVSFDGFVTKPYSFERIAMAIENLA